MPPSREGAPTEKPTGVWPHWGRHWLVDPAVGTIEFCLYRLLQLLPINLCSAIGARMGRYSPPEQRLLTERARWTLRHIFPRMSRRENEDAILDRLRSNAGRALIESMIARRICAADRISIADPGPLQAALDAERPLIFVSVHTSNLGDLLGAFLMRQTGHKAATTTRPFKNRFRQRLVDGMRRHPDLLILYPGVSSARRLIRHLSRPRHSALLHLDEARDHQIRFPAFNRRLPISGNLMLAIKLAELTGALVVPVHLRRLPDVRFTAHFATPIAVQDPTLPGAARSAERRAAVVRRLDEYFEAIIRESIDDWLQIYHVRV